MLNPTEHYNRATALQFDHELYYVVKRTKDPVINKTNRLLAERYKEKSLNAIRFYITTQAPNSQNDPNYQTEDSSQDSQGTSTNGVWLYKINCEMQQSLSWVIVPRSGLITTFTAREARAAIPQHRNDWQFEGVRAVELNSWVFQSTAEALVNKIHKLFSVKPNRTI